MIKKRVMEEGFNFIKKAPEPMPRGFHDYQQEGHGYTMPFIPL